MSEYNENLLLEDYPLMVLPKLACAIGDRSGPVIRHIDLSKIVAIENRPFYEPIKIFCQLMDKPIEVLAFDKTEQDRVHAELLKAWEQFKIPYEWKWKPGD